MTQQKTVLAVVAMGSNLGDPFQFLFNAKNELIKLPNCSNFKFSSLYKTLPIGLSNAPDFLNGVVSFETTFSAHQLLDHLKKIEGINHRERITINAPRTLDLDLLLYGQEIIADQSLVVPHPRLHERFFVLTPLAEIHPTLIHPILGKQIQHLESDLANLYPREKYILS